MKVDPVRARALDILQRVHDGAALDAVLGRHLDELDSERDKAFLAELVRGTLQWRGRYDHVVAGFARKRPPRDPRLLNLLRLSLHQLIGLDGVPAYAAVDQGAELCRAAVSARLVGFVNGLLQAVRRRVSVSGADEQAVSEQRLRPLFADLQDDPPAWLAAWHSHPPWLVRRWCERYGFEQAESICAANNLPVRPAFRVLEPAPPGPAAAYLAAAGCPVRTAADPRTLLCEGRVPGAVLRRVLGERRELIVQDPSVQEATGWLLEALPANGLPLADLCAAPGGKTARLAAACGEDATIVAMDNRPARLRLLVDTLQRTGMPNVSVVQGDGTAPPLAAGRFGAVLLDGPCSGTGVLRRHPDGRWGLHPEAPVRNGERLLSLANQAVDLLAPGGVLLYATCSLEREENEDVLDRLLGGRGDLEPVPGTESRRRWLPGIGEGDGFFAARLRRTG